MNMAPLSLYFVILIVGKMVWELLFDLPQLRIKADGDLSSPSAKRATFLYSTYYTMHGIGFILYLHQGASLYFFLGIIALYSISKLNGSKYNPVRRKKKKKIQFFFFSNHFYSFKILTWLVAVAILISTDYCKGYHVFDYFLGNRHWIAKLIDGNRGSLPWHVYFRMTFLRVISHNFDTYWSYNNTPVYNVINTLI